MQQDPIFSGTGYIYNNGKMGGHGVSVFFYDQAMYVFGARAQAVGRAFGAAGVAAGSAIDQATQQQAEVAASYSDIQSVKIHKSLLNGAGIEFVLKNGAKFKIATQSMALGGVKKIYPQIAAAIRQVNPDVSLDPQI